MEGAGGKNWKRVLLTLPWAVVRFFGRITRRCPRRGGRDRGAGRPRLRLQSKRSSSPSTRTTPAEIDDYLGIDRTHDRAAARSAPTSPSNRCSSPRICKTVACISSPERRILIDDAADIPPLFVSAILASEDKNFFTHEGVDKAAIVRALIKRIAPGEPLGASTLTMQIAKHLRGGTGRASTEMEKIGDIVMALRIEREFSREQLLLKYVNMPYFGRGPIRHRSGEPRLFRQAREGSRASPGGVHRVAHQQAGAARPLVRDGSAAQDTRTRSATRTGRRQRAARFACST